MLLHPPLDMSLGDSMLGIWGDMLKAMQNNIEAPQAVCALYC